MSDKNKKSLLTKLRNKCLKIFGDIKINKHFPWIPYYKPEGYKIRGPQVRQLLETCKPGDILLRGYTDYLDGLFIGKWSHAGLVYNEKQVIHSMAEGVFVEDILHFFRTDRVCILRAKLQENEIQEVVKEAKGYIGSPYDFSFNFNNPNEVSCSEFTYLCFKKYKENLGMFKKLEKFAFIKRETVRPALFLEFKGFEKILEL